MFTAVVDPFLIDMYFGDRIKHPDMLTWHSMNPKSDIL
jgi:hypothetical protein